MKGVEPGHTDQALGIRWKRRLRRICLAEDEFEIRPDGGKLVSPPEGEIHLQSISQQEYTEQRRAVHYVHVGDCFMIVIEEFCPFLHHLIMRGCGLQTESQVNVGPAI